MLRGLVPLASKLRHNYQDGLRRRFTSADATSLRVAAKRKATVPAEPATVKPYERHVFVQLPRPADAPEGGPWWPSVIESNPALLGMFSRVAAMQAETAGAMKITAMEEVGPPHGRRMPRGDSATAFVYPEGAKYECIPVLKLPEIIDRHMTVHEAEPEDAALDRGMTALEGVQLFVCCHGSRDSRCGSIGVPLARRLQTVANNIGLGDVVNVYMCSHIGGHKYAGNVLVFGAHPCSGDWFGGLRADDAEAFMSAMSEMEIGSDGGPSDPLLKKWWRGRMGMDKADQQQFFDCGCLHDDVDAAVASV